MESLTRRSFLIASGAIAASGVLGACGMGSVRPPAEVAKYYPELTGLPVKKEGTVQTALTYTKWFNLANVEINPEQMKTTFSYFEELAKKQWLISYSLNGQDLPFILLPRPQTQRVIFFDPEKAANPNWQGILPHTDAATTGKFDNNIVTFVRVFDSDKNIPPSLAFTDREKAANKVFFIEACQSSFAVRSVSPDVATLGQEIIANSLGTAFAIRQMNIPYGNYARWAKDVVISSDLSDPRNPLLPLYVMRQQDFESMPTIGQVIIVK